MSMINCPECGKEISDKAKACPNCGFPIEKYQKEKDFPTFTILSFLLMLLFAISMLFFHIGWIINSILLIATFVFSFIALKSKEKLSILSAITLIISGIAIAMILLELLIL